VVLKHEEKEREERERKKCLAFLKERCKKGFYETPSVKI